MLKHKTKHFESIYGRNKRLKEFERYNGYAYNKGVLKPLYILEDTTLIINEVGLQSGDIYGMIWNKKDTVTYLTDSCCGFNIKIQQEPFYKQAALKIIASWNTDTLQYYHNHFGAFDAGYLYLTRIVRKNTEIKFDCFEIWRQFEW